MSRATPLLILEYAGTARSGKGTIVKYLADKYSGVCVEETGIDYRLLTKLLLDDGSIKGTNSLKEVETIINKLGLKKLTNLVIARDQFVEKFGREAFYRPAVNDFVATLGQVELVRSAVKGGFLKRIETLRDTDECKAVLIDGRSLSKLLEAVPNTKILLKTFVHCSSFEAGLRECNREKIDPASQQGSRIIASLAQRNKQDAERSIDPNKPEAKAIDYWGGTEIQELSKKLNSAKTMNDYLDLVHRDSLTNDKLPVGIGRKAVKTGQQIYFDTSVFRLFYNPKDTMLKAAELMYQEAIGAS